eukprot:3733675-Amphidinium_carterae.1
MLPMAGHRCESVTQPDSIQGVTAPQTVHAVRHMGIQPSTNRARGVEERSNLGGEWTTGTSDCARHTEGPSHLR